MRIVAFSTFVVDYYPRYKVKRVGGNSANFAVECARHGNDVSVVGAVGTEETGDFIVEHLNKHGVDTSHLHRVNGHSATNSLLHDENGDRYSPAGAWKGGVYEEFILSAEDWDFVNSFDLLATTSLGPNFPDIFKQLDAHVKLVIDFMHTADWELWQKHHPRIDLAFFSGGSELLDPARHLAEKYGKPIIVTMGAQGSRAFFGKRDYHHPAPVVEKIVDTTGCGDVFQAAFSLSWFKDHDLEKALEAGTQAAAGILGVLGGSDHKTGPAG
jgi:sugar/nucleoside kinase (ribokinase family)